MESKAHHVLVGAFVVVASLILVLAVLWLGRTGMDRDYYYYEVVFTDEVSGLSPGSAVEFSGITVGDVQSLRLDEDDPGVVRVRIRVAQSTPVREDTGARLGLANITGSALIRLYGGSSDSPRLQGTEAEPAVIMAERSGLNRLLANSESLLGDVNRFMQNVNSMFTEENTQRVTNTLDNIEQVTAMLAEQRFELGESMQALRKTLQQAETTLQDVSQLTQRADGLLAADGEPLMQSMQSTMAQVDEAAKTLNRLLVTNEAAIDDGLQGLATVGPVAEELGRTLRALQRATQRFESDPGSFILQREEIIEVDP